MVSGEDNTATDEDTDEDICINVEMQQHPNHTSIKASPRGCTAVANYFDHAGAEDNVWMVLRIKELEKDVVQADLIKSYDSTWQYMLSPQFTYFLLIQYVRCYCYTAVSEAFKKWGGHTML